MQILSRTLYKKMVFNRYITMKRFLRVVGGGALMCMCVCLFNPYPYPYHHHSHLKCLMRLMLLVKIFSVLDDTLTCGK